MATTRIMPLHCGKGRSVGKAISDIIDYVKNPEKTDHGRLITSYGCNSQIADAEFLFAKRFFSSVFIISSFQYIFEIDTVSSIIKYFFSRQLYSASTLSISHPAVRAGGNRRIACRNPQSWFDFAQ